MEWEFGVSRCRYIGEINNKILLYSTGNVGNRELYSVSCDK